LFLPETPNLLRYVTDFDPYCALALVSTVSSLQAAFLRDFIHKYLALRSSIGVEIDVIFPLCYNPPLVSLSVPKQEGWKWDPMTVALFSNALSQVFIINGVCSYLLVFHGNIFDFRSIVPPSLLFLGALVRRQRRENESRYSPTKRRWSRDQAFRKGYPFPNDGFLTGGERRDTCLYPRGSSIHHGHWNRRLGVDGILFC
jgi:hypothetical protein